MGNLVRLLVSVVLLCAVLAEARKRGLGRGRCQDGHRINIHRGHKRGERNFLTEPSEDVGRRLRNYRKGVNKTKPFEAGAGEYFEFDIMLKEDVEENAVPLGSDPTIRWPNAVVPYQIIGTFTADEMKNIEWAIKHYADNTCVRFVKRTTETNYIQIDNKETGCWSYVGRSLNNNYNLMNLQTPTCMETGTVVHEFMHALGFYHEFTRPDRDEWIKFDQGALEPAYQTESFLDANFGKLSPEQSQLYGVQYNYGSVMHYSKWAGAVDNNRPVMNNIKPWAYNDFGNDTGLSASDVMNVNYMYCNSTTTLTTTLAPSVSSSGPITTEPATTAMPSTVAPTTRKTTTKPITTTSKQSTTDNGGWIELTTTATDDCWFYWNGVCLWRGAKIQ